MSAQRRRKFEEACGLAGDPPVHIIDSRDGWPGIATVLTGLGTIRVALHVTTPTPHGREDYEWRIQNPADRTPVEAPRGTVPLFVGLDTDRGILVMVDARSRVGREKRFSIIYNFDILTRAARDGWAEYTSDTGERVVALHPKLLPIFVQALRANAWPAQEALVGAASASGVSTDNDEPAADRARVLASRLVRSAAFSRDVRNAYKQKCAMCGLSLELVQGAHIYPVSADKAPDKVWNGISLCYNHHGAFDKHLIWIDPASYETRLHPTVIERAKRDVAVQSFLKGTRPDLWVPSNVKEKPRRDMLERRYEYYSRFYKWV